ncbi:hypothetical protein ONS95_012089 [Cadophora gregata]|uniref:uncharacterized protein n=1 Tax=Cadophora gregata TaxID=51156 RepID=UPI0026DA9510|nr:uncharacterized protein ONS95_012089 [Cadophora gregata]KAK0117763.1 hypothetical protein ONS95_012089 [Cadophora gregata]KAK0122813.1 hypothetical protein ONS96_009846 [Cadophora gregata f. sp. sojae]
MRLIHTSTRELQEFYNDIPEYAILSHTWDEKELLFEDFKSSAAKDLLRLPGFEKVDNCCKLAASRDFQYVWIDTCCIDKNSSSELQEAINSMYRWYKNAEVCFAFLSDVPSNGDPTKSPTAFKASLWFTRGWTLQELLAPRTVEFYGKNEEGSEWGEIGTKSSLRTTIAQITGIPHDVLKTGDFKDISIATRMSWASRRQTKRVEDQAYSLMGIFNVHMPMVYGEGKRAFERLQEEIMKVSDDHSLFAWRLSTRSLRHWTGQGLLADSPADFLNSGHYRCSNNNASSAAYQITNLGLRIQLPLLRVSPNQATVESGDDDNDDEDVATTPGFHEYYGVLNCCSSSRDLDRLGIILRLTENEDSEERGLKGSRCRTREIVSVSPAEVALAETRVIYITRNQTETPSVQESPYVDCHISFVINSKGTVKFVDAWPTFEADGAVKAKGRRRKAILAAISLKYTLGLSEGIFTVVLGLFDGEAWCDIVADEKERNAKAIWKSHRYLNQTDRSGFYSDGKKVLSVAIRKRGKQGSNSPGKVFTLSIEDHPGDT